MFIRQFEAFDPVSSDVPEQPFPYLSEIAMRARAILTGRTIDQIVAAAKRINLEIEGYFDELKSLALFELDRDWDIRVESFETYYGVDTFDKAVEWLSQDGIGDILGIPTASNCSEVDALKTVIENRDSLKDALEPDGYEEGKDYELFAVLSLWLVSDSLNRIQKGDKHSLSIAGGFAVKAMDAVCHAEHLREVEWLNGLIARNLDKMTVNQEELRSNWESEWKEHEREKRTKRAKQMNVARHAPTNHAKKEVIAEWVKNPSQFSSAEKAGIYYADWLVSHGIIKSIEPRCVANWIRAHAKVIGVRFR